MQFLQKIKRNIGKYWRCPHLVVVPIAASGLHIDPWMADLSHSFAGGDVWLGSCWVHLRIAVAIFDQWPDWPMEVSMENLGVPANPWNISQDFRKKIHYKATIVGYHFMENLGSTSQGPAGCKAPLWTLRHDRRRPPNWSPRPVTGRAAFQDW